MHLRVETFTWLINRDNSDPKVSVTEHFLHGSQELAYYRQSDASVLTGCRKPMKQIINNPTNWCSPNASGKHKLLEHLWKMRPYKLIWRTSHIRWPSWLPDSEGTLPTGSIISEAGFSWLHDSQKILLKFFFVAKTKEWNTSCLQGLET